MLPTPSVRQLLDLQARLIDGLPDSYIIDMISASAPPIPTIVIFDIAKKPVLKISPMRNGRYRLSVSDHHGSLSSFNKDYYFDHDFKESRAPMKPTLYARVAKILRLSHPI